MKKRLSLIIVLATLISLFGCSNKIDVPNLLSREGVAPYELSENEEYVLQSFGMEDNSHIISFHAPKEALTLKVNIHSLDSDGNWSNINAGGISIGVEREPVDQLIGTFTIQLKENYEIDFNINNSGRASYKTEEIILDTEMMSSSIGFLEEFEEIEINKELPVALMVYSSGTSIRTHTLQDHFKPEKFEGMDFVQVVTLTFSDQEL